jgi:hypothetical protein
MGKGWENVGDYCMFKNNKCTVSYRGEDVEN